MKRDSRSRSRALTKSAEKERLRRLSIGKEITVKHYRVDQRTFSSVYKGSPKSPKTRLGKGAQGTVFLATNRYTGLQVAVKTLDKIFLEESEIKILMKEIQLLACADHPSIIRILESYEDMHYIYLVMELCEGGNLHEFIDVSSAPMNRQNVHQKNNSRRKIGRTNSQGLKRHMHSVGDAAHDAATRGKKVLKDLIFGSQAKELTEREAMTVVSQIVEGMCYLHARNMAHRDLKLENIMILEPKGDRKASIRDLTLKIIDFGFIEKYDEHKSLLPGEITRFQTHGLVGTGPFMAPEILQEMFALYCEESVERKSYEAQPCDCWALGVMTYLLIARELPFDNKMRSTIGSSVRGPASQAQFEVRFDNPVWKKVSRVGKDFITGLLRADPEERMTMQEALTHGWLQPMHTHLTGDPGDPSSQVVDPSTVASIKGVLNCFEAYSEHLCVARRALVYHFCIFLPKKVTSALSKKFRMLDFDGTGIISEESLLQAMKVVGYTAAESRERMKKYRGTLLGKSMEISFTKFVTCYIALVRFTDNAEFVLVLKSFFTLLDEDGDGKISPQDITDVCADARLPLKVSTHMLSFLGPDKKGHIGFKAFRKLFATDQLECFRSRVQNTLDFSDITGRESDLAAARAAINVDHVDLVEAAGSRAKNSWVDVKEKKTNARG
jgi:serine/threonine protein kinase